MGNIKLTEVLLYWPSNNEVNTCTSGLRFAVAVRTNVQG